MGKLFWLMAIVSAGILSTLPGAIGSAIGYEEVEVVEGGTIFGTVKFTGMAPPIPAIKVVKNPDVCGLEVRTPILVVNPSNQGLKDTVVYIEQIEKGKMLPDKVTIDSIRCLFEPHVTGVVRNRNMAMRNSDPVLHNPHTFNERGATVFNIAIPEQGQTVERRMRSGGVIRLQCDQHAHMNAWVISLEHPYFAVTDENGQFEIKNVPAGRYQLVAWHQGYHITNGPAYEESVKAGTEEIERPMYDEPHVVIQEIEVLANQNTHVEFEVQGR